VDAILFCAESSSSAEASGDAAFREMFGSRFAI
jgi:hypothetical protein